MRKWASVQSAMGREWMVAPEDWPNEEAHYEFAGGNAAALEKWQALVEGALAEGNLVLTHQFGDTYFLTGACPRCGHGLGKVVEFAVRVPGGATKNSAFDVSTTSAPRRVDSVIVDVPCSCSAPHEGRGEKRSGCGWGKGMPVKLDKPRTG